MVRPQAIARPVLCAAAEGAAGEGRALDQLDDDVKDHHEGLDGDGGHDGDAPRPPLRHLQQQAGDRDARERQRRVAREEDGEEVHPQLVQVVPRGDVHHVPPVAAVDDHRREDDGRGAGDLFFCPIFFFQSVLFRHQRN